jgi:hypothetical protein
MQSRSYFVWGTSPSGSFQSDPMAYPNLRTALRAAVLWKREGYQEVYLTDGRKTPVMTSQQVEAATRR